MNKSMAIVPLIHDSATLASGLRSDILALIESEMWSIYEGRSLSHR